MFMVLVYTFCFLVGFLLWSLQPPKRPKNYPPGPRRFGFLGSFPNFVLKNELNFFELLSRTLVTQYEKVMVFDLGPMPLITINDVQALKEAFSKNALAGRPPFAPAQLYKETRGFVMRHDEEAKEIQKFTINQLKNFGFGKQTLGLMILDEAEELAKVLRSKANTPLSTNHFFNISAFNVLWHIISGERLSLDNKKAHQLLDMISSLSQDSLKMGCALAFPSLIKWVPVYFDDIRAGQQVARELFEGVIQERKRRQAESEDQSEHDQDFTEAFVKKIFATTDPGSGFYGEKAYENAAVTLIELFIGGIETSGTTLSWISLLMALHPDIQDKMQRQIDFVLQGEKPNLQHKIHLPYVEAVINETLRKFPVLPVGVHHITVEDTTIGGYDVPKGTTVLANIYAIHHSKKTWGDPHIFRPERFLSPDENEVIKHEAFVPFALGKKRCPGEQLARDSLFLIITTIFSEFSVALNPDEPRPSEEVPLKAVINPPPHTLIFSQRQKRHH